MKLNYEEVPSSVVTGKDLDYLSDCFEWNYGALKKTNNDKNLVNDSEIVSIFEKASNLFDDNLNTILKILESRGPASE